MIVFKKIKVTMAKDCNDTEEEILSVRSIFVETEVKRNPEGNTDLTYGLAPNTITLTITG